MIKQVTPKKGKYRKRPSLGLWLALAVLLLILVAVESFAIYTVFTSRFTSGNDFFVRWLGGREYLLHGTNPFDQSVAEKAQMSMFGRLTTPEDKDEAYFAYPLYTFYFFWPLSLISYPWAQAIWMTLLQIMLMGATLLAIQLSGWRPPRWLFWMTFVWGILFYNGARAIILGQFSILVALALFLALWSIDRRYDGWAGVLLSFTTIKPQMVFMVLLFLLGWALFQQRWRLIASFLVSMLILMASSMLLVPTWPYDFVRNAIAYSDYVAFGTPLENLLHYFFPAQVAAPLTLILSILFFLLLLPGWWFAWRNRQGGYTWSIMSTLIVGSLITFRSATTNQVILYLPLFFFFRRLAQSSRLNEKWVNRVIVFTEVGLFLVMWGAFVALIEGNWEHVMMHGLLPAILLVIYIFDWRALWRTAQAEASV